jgi:Uri superfamily endonuclease
LNTAHQLSVGKLGVFNFPAGVYAYAGSALGPGGLAARLARHLRHPKPLHWHIDYLRAHSRPRVIWLLENEGDRECIWAEVMSQMDGASRPVPGFGSSDCRCLSHLVHFTTLADRTLFERIATDTITEILLDE